MEKIRLTVNHEEIDLEVDPESPLLYVLRNDLKLNAPKFGCGLEQCGACMVWIDGEPLPSCVRPCSTLTGTKIETLESIGTREKLHPVQQAFFDEQAAQCGYCLNGMLVCAKSLLDKNPTPSEEEIHQALKRVLCRCGSHSRIVRAIQKVARQ